MSGSGVEQALRSGELWLGVRRYDQALDAANRALAVEPTNVAAHALACRALIGLERYPEAARAARFTVSNNPERSDGYRLLSIAIRKSPGGNSWPGIGEALSAAAEAVRLAPVDSANHTNLAETSVVAGRLDLADEAIRRAISLTPASAATWASASFVAIKARNWKAAEQAARRALSIDPGNYAAMNNLGVATRRRGGRGVGAVAFLEAARMDPRSPTARENLEGVGFQYMARFSPLLLLPLLVFWPAFVAARVGVARWLVQSRPQRLRPLARRIGMRIATSKRQRRRLERNHQRAVRRMSRPGADQEWSALKTVKPASRRFQTALAVVFGVVAVGLVSAVIADPRSGAAPGQLVMAVAFAAGFIVMILSLRRRIPGGLRIRRR